MSQLTTNKYFFIVTALALLLGIPFLAKIAFSSKEIYPSVVMPAAGSKVNIGKDGTCTFEKRQLYGIDPKTGTEIELNHTRFIFPAPIHDLRGMIMNDLGLFTYDKHTDQYTEVTNWWRQKLKEQHCSENVIIARKLKIDSKDFSQTVIDEKIYTLD
ncbi:MULTISPECIES: hypothetical protein [Reichenbachiella]|uniref:hypothetical protein n=1 Tax=Reichenbachiella TaxID=156993 RepID=UPI000E6C5FF2|nr:MULTISPECIES: hypothetical protein [Reichenbachiella]MBU2912397.1 hypothetical protein [Reichenbachiella agariperforans]